MNAILKLAIIDSPVMWGVYAVAVILVLFLALRRPTAGWVLRAAIGVLVGIALGTAAYFLGNATGLASPPMPPPVLIWVAGALGAVGLAVVSLRRSRVRRKVVAIISVVWFILAAIIGVNAYYGINPTLGSLIGVVASDPIDLGTRPTTSTTPTGPLAETWTAPADMPAVGRRGTATIPGTVSGFAARDAGIYLPPAAQVSEAPALPLVIMMMGDPGSPDPTIIGDVLDTFAAAHQGLAPIVIVADQLGLDGVSDPACADSTKFGNAETYITTDVVAWARANLNIIDDPRYWSIAGYSNGGGCAIKYGAKYPDTFHNIIDVSGEEYPGSEDPADVLATIYGGDKAAFEAAKPIAIMQAAPAGRYDGVTAVFTAGTADPEYIAASTKVSEVAQSVGMATTLYAVPGADHGGSAVSGGLTEGFTVLYPVLGLSG